MRNLPIKNWGGYSINANGEVFSYWGRTTNLKMILIKKGKIIANKPLKSGHVTVTLRKRNNIVKKFLIHRLVAEAFIPNPNNYPYVCHKDGNPKNNKIDNLYWGTQKMNISDTLKHGTRLFGEKCNGAKLNIHKVKLIRLLNRKFNWTQNKLIKLFPISNAQMSRILSNKRWIYA